MDVETDPERAALLRDTQEAVQEANARLAPRHREVLALREVAGRSYDEVAEIMGITPNAAAQLIWRARTKLREALTAGAVASVVATSEECEWAQMLLNRVQDDEPVDAVDREWLDEHLDKCGSCQTANRMLLEAGASYRMWLPVALLAGMRTDTLTAAGGVVGADWSGVAAPGQAGGSPAGGAGGVAAVAGGVIVAAAIAFLALTGDDKPKKVSAPAAQPAVEEPAAPAMRTPARPDKAKPEKKVVAARAPRAAPAVAKLPTPTAERPAAVQTPPAPPQRPERRSPPPKSGPGPPAPPPPQPKVEPPPVRVVPAPAVQPAPPAPTGCNWSGGGKGPSGCPPGQGGIPPGHGGTPPGLGDRTPPGRAS
jgi:predicted DNA-binding protein (UPF0251 family)